MMGKAKGEGEGKTHFLSRRHSLERHTHVETLHINAQPAIVILSKQQYLIPGNKEKSFLGCKHICEQHVNA